jgi:hypothetical protein
MRRSPSYFQSANLCSRGFLICERLASVFNVASNFELHANSGVMIAVVAPHQNTAQVAQQVEHALAEDRAAQQRAIRSGEEMLETFRICSASGRCSSLS